MRRYSRDVLCDLTHEPLSKLLAVAADIRLPPDLPAFVVTRNPWSYYVSRWAQRQQHAASGQEVGPLSRLPFREQLIEAYYHWFAGTLPDAIVGRTFAHLSLSQWHAFIVDVPYPPLVTLRYEDWPAVADFLRRTLGIDAAKMADEQTAIANASKHEDYRTYYDVETFGMVSRMDADYCARYGYTFEG